jgi:NADPH2:quinone reductase
MVKMQALILNRYNGPLELSEVTRPKPSAGEVLVRIAASGLNPLDAKIRAGEAAHAKHPVPLVLGIDLAGVIEEIGPGVIAFQVSDEVYGMTGASAEFKARLRSTRRSTPTCWL